MIAIKFKAWDAELNKMLSDGDYWLPKVTLKYIGTNHPSEKECHPIHITNRGVHFMRRLTNSIVWVEVHDDTHAPKSKSYYDDWEYERVAELPIIQFTGCKDNSSRGIELYHHDLIVNPFRNNSEAHEIIWSETYGGWCGKYGKLEYLIAQELESITKVGNIYENPELLKEDK